ncbi:hypothetical protein F4802DRAFT_360329 [Xylaria palmicola]|nr:hypothetical protein F4802DRAFT_360329 [Xylaria palmicola]
MLPFHSRTDRSGGAPLGSRRSPTPTTTASSSDHKPLHASRSKSSLRGRFKTLKGSITKRLPLRCSQNRVLYAPEPWYNAGSNNDLSRLLTADSKHADLAGQTWPAIRKSISSMASSLRANRGSMHCSNTPGEGSHEPSSPHPRIGSKAAQGNPRRWATLYARVPPAGPRRSTSFSTISESISRQSDESVPQLPRLASSSNFLESLSRTGLFRKFTPPSEANDMHGNGPLRLLCVVQPPGSMHPPNPD